jgi:hypothetical protein
VPPRRDAEREENVEEVKTAIPSRIYENELRCAIYDKYINTI